jgi:hypothetical protein
VAAARRALTADAARRQQHAPDAEELAQSERATRRKLDVDDPLASRV